MAARRLSIGWELEVIEQTVGALHLLCDEDQQELSTERLRAVAATIILVRERIRLVRRALSGLVPLDAVAAPHNTFDAAEEDATAAGVCLDVS